MNYYYQSSGNKLDRVIDHTHNADGFYEKSYMSTARYLYDANGNLTVDLNKDISIEYNILNLPYSIESTLNSDEISYIYDASGIKWLKKYIRNGSLTNTMYAGSFVYEDASGINNYSLDYILNSEGLIEMNGMTLNDYQYNIKDHLGNTRITFNAGTLIAEQALDYYPYGMSFPGTQGGDNKYLYNGKELQDDMLGSVNLDWYDYGARFYDPAIGRWNVPDPLAEFNLNQSPYNYVKNNPLYYLDPYGLRELSEEQKRRRAEAANRSAARRHERFVKRLERGGFTNGGSIGEVICVGQRGTGNSKSSHTQNSSRDFGFIFYTQEGGQNGTNPDANGPWIDYDIFSGLNLWAKQKQYKGPVPPTTQSIANKSLKLAIEVTSDEEIINENTGTAETTSSSGEPISRLEERVKKQGLDSLPIIQNYPSWWTNKNSYDKNGKAHGPFNNGDTIRWEYYKDGERTGDSRFTK